MNANLRLSKLISHRSSFNAPDGRQINVLIIPIQLNNLEFISEDQVNFRFICFERNSASSGIDTHILKQDLTDEQKKAMTADKLENMPILGNLIDWEKTKSEQQTAKSIVSGHINLRSIESIIRKYRLKNGQLTDCLVFDISKNYLYHHENGDLSLNFILFKIKNPKGEVTHTIKLSAPKDVYEAMSAEESKKLPYIGAASQRFITNHVNNDNDLEKIAGTTIESFDDLSSDYAQNISDDLPF